MKNSISIILPIYNPPVGWEHVFLKNYNLIIELLGEFDINFVLVNDGSKKNIYQTQINYISQISKVDFLHLSTNKGKGAAVRHGLMNANSNYYVYTDYDFPYIFQNIKSIAELLSQNRFDVVFGTRTKEYNNHLSFKRNFINKTCIFLNEKILQLPHADTQSGLKAFNEKGKKIMLTTKINRFLFDTEFILKATKNKDIKLTSIDLTLKSNIIFSKMSYKTMLVEAVNFARIFLMRIKF
ncbi:MAG: glycosyltransferase family 2 protein [Bacteroidetes bacterium]|nr:glycosyltransferase family 2 protein [Bacteroidota bacterium]